MSQSIENKVISRIYGRGRGWAFTKIDFVAEFGEANIHQALSNLTKTGKIRRVCQGVYDYPRFSQLLDRQMSPDLDQVAHALARKFNWRIQPAGDAALNLLGLSTQVPGRWIYLSDGPGRKYEIGKHDLEFKKSALKDVGFKYKESGVLVQALKALGQEHVDEKVIDRIRQQFEPDTYDRILKDTRSVTGWIYEIIKRIAKQAN